MKRSISVFLLMSISCLLLLALPQELDSQPLGNKAGFIEIEPIEFYFHFGSYMNRLALKSSRTRIWYSFHAAEKNQDNAPIFIFFNGGPGGSTSSGLMSMYTGRYTLDNTIESGGGTAYISNPVPWTNMGHLLFIDARQTGFSYSLMDTVQDEGARFREFNAQNYNSLFDGADFVRVILRFLADHPTLQDNPVVIVGESYGGTRSTAMLYLVLNYADLSNGSETYQDTALADEIQAHFDEVFPGFAGQVVPPDVIAQQFGYQVLVQPTVSMGYQSEIQRDMYERPGSPLYQIAKETGIPYSPEMYPNPFSYIYAAGRDVYIYTKPTNWLNGFFDNAGVLLRTVQNLSQVTGYDVKLIPELYASSRSNAYKIITSDYEAGLTPEVASPVTRELFITPALYEAPHVREEPGDMISIFGTLWPWDRYFIGLNLHSNMAFHVWSVALIRGYDIHYSDTRYGRMFLKNLAHVNTFITNAAYDLVVYGKAIPPSLARHTEIVSSVQHDKLKNEKRPGRFFVHYVPGAFSDIPNLTSRPVRFPFYSQSCHAVSLTQPEDFYTDVHNWLKANGISLQ